MWTIAAGELQLECETILEETVNRNGMFTKGVKVYFPGGISGEQVDALLNKPWDVYDGDGVLMGVHAGYGEAVDCCVTFLKAGEPEQLAAQLEQLTRELAQKTRELQAREAQLDGVAQLLDNAGVTLEGLVLEAERRKGFSAIAEDSQNEMEGQ